MKVLSLFDGISGARQALKELNIDCDYYASEIDKYAIQIAKANHPDILQIGDVKNIDFYDGWGDTRAFRFNEGCPFTAYDQDVSEIDLLIGGSPCQDLSIAKKDRKGLAGDRSSLFYEYLRILNEVKPKYFILENVASMSKASKEIITKELFDIEPIMINSALLTAQNRKRLYWVGKLVDGEHKQAKIDQPKDQEIYLKDIAEENVDEKYYIKLNQNQKQKYDKITTDVKKSNCLTEAIGRGGSSSEFLTSCKKITNVDKEYKQVKTEQPKDKGIYLKDIIEEGAVDRDKSYCIDANYHKGGNLKSYFEKGRRQLVFNKPLRVGHFNKGGQGDRVCSQDGKSVCLSANGGGKGAKTGLYAIAKRGRYVKDGKTEQRFETSYSEKANALTRVQKDSMLLDDYKIRKLTPTECCRLQGFPDDYVSMVSNTQGYKGLGNSFTVPVIKHLIKNLILIKQTD